MLKYVLLGPTPRVSDSLGLRWDAMICIPTKLPNNADVAGLGILVTTVLLYQATCFIALLLSSIFPSLSLSGDIL